MDRTIAEQLECIGKLQAEIETLQSIQKRELKLLDEMVREIMELEEDD